MRHVQYIAFIVLLPSDCTSRFAHANRHCVVHPNAYLKRSDGDEPTPVAPSTATEEEREWFSRYMGLGYRDVFRDRNPELTDVYSWWSYRFGARKKNIGWRIDYILACPRAAPFVTDAFIWPKVRGSDHCPLGVDVSPDILRP